MAYALVASIVLNVCLAVALSWALTRGAWRGKALPRRLFAAMAQQDCGQCGYMCETYSKAIADGAETKLNLCVPGGKETSRMLKSLLVRAPAVPRQGSDPSRPGSDPSAQRRVSMHRVGEGSDPTGAHPLRAVGARVPRVDGWPKVAGTDKFGADEAPADALWMRVVRSPHARARFALGELRTRLRRPL